MSQVRLLLGPPKLFLVYDQNHKNFIVLYNIKIICEVFNMSTIEIQISAINNRINVLRTRTAENGAIVKKLERRKRALQAKLDK